MLLVALLINMVFALLSFTMPLIRRMFLHRWYWLIIFQSKMLRPEYPRNSLLQLVQYFTQCLLRPRSNFKSSKRLEVVRQ